MKASTLLNVFVASTIFTIEDRNNKPIIEKMENMDAYESYDEDIKKALSLTVYTAKMINDVLVIRTEEISK